MEFLDNQAVFAEVFGDKPTIIPQNIVMLQDTTTTARSLYLFGEKCKLDVFMHMCRKYYVVHNSVDNSLIIQDVCCKIIEIKKEWKDKNGMLMRGKPDELFHNFCGY